MDRRSFLTALIGGIAVAGLAKATAAEAAAPSPETMPVDISNALDRVEAEFSQNPPHGQPRQRRERPHGSVSRRHWKHHHTRRRHNNFDRGRT